MWNIESDIRVSIENLVFGLTFILQERMYADWIMITSVTSIMGTIAISEDEERFAFFVDDSQSKSNLVVCKMGLYKK